MSVSRKILFLLRYMVAAGPFFVEISEILFVLFSNRVHQYDRPAGVEVRFRML
jgi:hypothetical protein